MSLSNYNPLSAADATIDQTSAFTDIGIGQYAGYSIQVIINGTASGTVQLEGSSEPSIVNPNFTANPSNFELIDSSLQNIDGSSPVLYNVSGVFYNYVRVVFKHASSSGAPTITAIFNSRSP